MTTLDTIDLNTLFTVHFCQMFMDRATRERTRNRICWDARTERIQREEIEEKCDGRMGERA